MIVPQVDWQAIKTLTAEIIQAYGTPAQFIEQGSTTSRGVKVVIYRDAKVAPLVQDASYSPAFVLLDPADFSAPHRKPQQFDTLKIDLEGYTGTWAIAADPHLVMAERTLPLIICELERA